MKDWQNWFIYNLFHVIDHRGTYFATDYRTLLPIIIKVIVNKPRFYPASRKVTGQKTSEQKPPIPNSFVGDVTYQYPSVARARMPSELRYGVFRLA